MFGTPGGTGGLRHGVENTLIAYPGYSSSGPYDFGGSPGMVYPTHYALPGQTAQQALTAVGGIGANVIAYGWKCLVINWGVNDVYQEFDVNGATDPNAVAATVAARRAQIVTDARAALPNIKIVSCSIVCEACSYAPAVAALNVLLRDAAASSGCIWCDFGTPHTVDTKHPVEGPTGYGGMAGAVSHALLQAFTS